MKITLFLLIGILVISGFGCNTISEKNSIIKLPTFFDEYDMVIIAPEVFSDEIKPLIDHKNIHDVTTFLMTTDKIYEEYDGRDSAEKIKIFIRDSIESYGVKYVLLIGGRKGQTFSWFIPPRYSNVDDGFMHKQFLSDLYFSDIYNDNGDFEDWDSNCNGIFADWYSDSQYPHDNMDLKPDVALGRLSCRNEKEVESVVDKIIYYEDNAFGESWFNNALFIGGDTNPGKGEPFPFEGEADCKYTIQFFEDFDVTELYVSDDTLGSYHDFISSFNKGNGFVLFHGHGLQDGLFTHTSEGEQLMVFDNRYLSRLNNDGMYPIMVVGCCLTTEFDVGILNFVTILNNLKQHHYFLNFKYECVSECLAWNMVKKVDGGTIAFLGDSSTSWGQAGDINNDGIPDSVKDGYTSGLCAEFFRIIGEEKIDILGDVYVNTLINVIENYSGQDRRVHCKCIQEFQLIGDPSLKIGGYSND
jgi:hypothetical protein